MVLSALTAWCCQLFGRICRSLAEGYFKSLSKTTCFFYNPLCGETSTKNVAAKTIDVCNFKYYFDYTLKKISSPWCNISTVDNLSKDKLTKRDNLSTDLTCQIPRESSCPKENWCNLSDHLNYWWRKLHDNWCTVAGCTVKQKDMENNALIKVVAAENEQGFFNWFHAIKLNYINGSNVKLLAAGCVIGGLLTSIYLVYARKPSNSKSTTHIDNVKKLLKSDDCNADKLIEILEAVNEESVELKNKIDENDRKSLKIIEQLQAEIKRLNEEFLDRENETQNQLLQQSEVAEELQEYVINLKARCDDYEDEARRLREHVRKEIGSYEDDVRQLNEELARIKAGTARRSADDRKENCTSSDDDQFVTKALAKIERITTATVVLESEIEMFIGKKSDKDFLHLKEKLIRNAVDLDNVESDGHLIVRNKRKEALAFVYGCLNVLKSKAE